MICKPYFSLKFSKRQISFKEKILNGPGLGDFIQDSPQTSFMPLTNTTSVCMLQSAPCSLLESAKRVCRVVWLSNELLRHWDRLLDHELCWCVCIYSSFASRLMFAGYPKSNSFEEADIIFLNTCAIRENAEMKVWNRSVSLRCFFRSSLTLADWMSCEAFARRIRRSVIRHWWWGC